MSEATAQERPDRPIFIVGPSRSGTSMLRRILNQHSSVWVTHETHYFDDLRVRLSGSEKSPLTPAQADRCERYFLALGHSRYGTPGDPAKSRIPADTLRARAKEIGRGPDGYFEAFCRLEAERNGKTVWGEKTPRHIFRLDEILSCYPEARVIALVRDPRAVVASYRDWEGAVKSPERAAMVAADRRRGKRSYHVILASLLWRAAVRSSFWARARFGEERIYIQRYEDLVASPRESLAELTRWLGIDYEEAMVKVGVAGSSYGAVTEGRTISTVPMDRWRKKLSPGEIAVIQRCAGKLMRRAGYEQERIGLSLLHFVAACLTLPVAFIRAAVVNRRRVGSLFEFISKRFAAAFVIGKRA